MKRLSPALLIFIVALAVYGGSAGRAFKTIDTASVGVSSWRIADTGSPSLRGVSDSSLTAVPYGKLWTSTNARTGDLVIARDVGAVAAAVPAYAIASLVAPATRGHVTALPAALTAALLAAVALALLMLATEGLVPDRVRILGVLALGFTTPFWSIAGHDLWPQTLTALSLAGMAWGARRERWLLVGLFGAVGVLARLHFAIAVAVVGIAVALVRRRPAIALRVAMGSLPALALSVVWTRWVYGVWGLTAGYQMGDLNSWASSQSVSDRVSSFVGMFLSPGVGILVWTPAIALLLPALWRARRTLPDWTIALAAGSLAYMLVQLWLNPLSGGTGFWGYRISLELVVGCAPALIAAAPAAGRVARILLPVAVGAEGGVIVLGSVFGLVTSTGDPWHASVLWYVLQTSWVLVGAFMAGGVVATYLGLSAARAEDSVRLAS